MFIVRDWIRPYREKLDWPAFSFVFSPEEVGPAMMKTLRGVSPEKLLEMQVKMEGAIKHTRGSIVLDALGGFLPLDYVPSSESLLPLLLLMCHFRCT